MKMSTREGELLSLGGSRRIVSCWTYTPFESGFDRLWNVVKQCGDEDSYTLVDI